MDLNHEFHRTRDSFRKLFKHCQKDKRSSCSILARCGQKTGRFDECRFLSGFTSIHEVMIHNADHSYPEDLENVLRETIRKLHQRRIF